MLLLVVVACWWSTGALRADAPGPKKTATDLCEEAFKSLREKSSASDWSPILGQSLQRQVAEIVPLALARLVACAVATAETEAGIGVDAKKEERNEEILKALADAGGQGDATGAYGMCLALAEAVYPRIERLARLGLARSSATVEDGRLRSARVLFWLVNLLGSEAQRLGAGPYTVNPTEEQRMVRDIDASFAALRGRSEGFVADDWRSSVIALATRVGALEGRVAALEAEVDCLKQRVAALENERSCIVPCDSRPRCFLGRLIGRR
jgi:hypothetical protein